MSNFNPNHTSLYDNHYQEGDSFGCVTLSFDMTIKTVFIFERELDQFLKEYELVDDIAIIPWYRKK
jgi:hypothetical protein